MSENKKEYLNVYLSPVPVGLEQEFHTLLTPEAIQFLIDLNLHFRNKIEDLYLTRLERKFIQKKTHRIPKFLKSDYIKDDWKVAPVNHRLQNRHLDVGDVSPCNYTRFISSLNKNVQGIQVDFDDGHCPTWRNQIIGLYNIYRVVHNKILNIPKISDAPILMFRPRAWNMIEHNMSINGREIPGSLFDFGLLIFHNGYILSQCDSGPFFYLSKLEGAAEAKLWNEIFIWSQLRLRIPYGTIKACVLIENILSVFEMDQILYELKDHSLGLNCGIWDYAASIISKFGDDLSFVLPDRNKYVNMNRPFLKKYMDLVIKICHNRNTFATGGMIAKLLPSKQSKDFDKVLQNIIEDKLIEIQAGVDGFLIYDLGLIEFITNLWEKYGGSFPSQINYSGTSNIITETDLLILPTGGVTEKGLKHNISVTILFIYHWLCGEGVFKFKETIEDSATAEISRAQIWQWIRHAASIENKNYVVTRNLVFTEASSILKCLTKNYGNNNSARVKLAIAFNIFLEVVNCRNFPEFLTTYLNDECILRKVQTNL
ncbi:PREDICTED: malate synthase-like [Ceratosolen solmsi marchali]|uniref:malate synthase n=1 Tax=Ceratosolen solmsi marchali TaxID=326594 RepID=A0AAJ6VK86_9HYME|nr:PREDICTED: malate synthase-like [Ceratosolen solmsi marchali]